MEIRLLGLVVAVGATAELDLGGRNQRTLVALLASHQGSPVSADRCIDALWGETPPEGARHSLQTYISNLRGLLDAAQDGLLESASDGYVLKADTDAERFGTLVSDGTDATEIVGLLQRTIAID